MTTAAVAGAPGVVEGGRRLGPLLPAHLALPALLGALAGALLFPVALALTGSVLAASFVAVGCLGAVLAVGDPRLALLLVVVVEVSQTGDVLASLGVPSPLVVTQAIAVAALATVVLRGRLRPVPSPVLLATLVFLTTRLMTVAVAYDPEQALATCLSDFKDMLILFVVYALLLATRGSGWVVRGCVVVLAALSLLGVVQEYVLANSTDFLGFSQVKLPDVGSSSFRHTGPIADANFWGRVLLMFLPFAPALALSASGRLARTTWWLATVALLLGVFLTQSRGAFLATGAGLVVLLLLAGWQYTRWLALSPVLVGLLLVLPATGKRLATLADLGESSQGGGDVSLVLRLASQEAGLRMLEERPWLGVGAGNYEHLTPRFETGLSFATVGELGKPLAPHNAYLEFAAEGGVVGFLGFLGFLGTLAFCAWRAWRSACRARPYGSRNPERLLASACLASLAGWGVASFVLHVRQFRTLLVLAAVIAVLDALREPLAVRAARPPGRSLRRLGTPWAALTTVVVVLGLAVLMSPLSLRASHWRAEAVTIIATRSATGLDAYHYDLLTRGQLVPTLAGVVESRGVVSRSRQEAGLSDRPGALEVDVRTRPRSSDLLVRVDGEDPEAVRALADRLVAVGARSVDRLRTPFVLAPVRRDQISVVQVREVRVAAYATAGLLVLGVAVAAWAQLQAAHRRRVRFVRAGSPDR